jgi:membrane protein
MRAHGASHPSRGSTSRSQASSGRANSGRANSGRDDQGRSAARPTEIPAPGWRSIAKRVYQQTNADHISIVAAGVAFFAFLALFPALAAAFSI